MKQRCPYQIEAFDFEDIEVYGTIRAVDSLAGVSLQFIGWDSSGNVIWDTESPTAIQATVVVTDPAARTYAATVGPLPPDTTTTPAGNKVYSWQVRRPVAGQRAALVWGFLTITPSATPNDE